MTDSAAALTCGGVDVFATLMITITLLVAGSGYSDTIETDCASALVGRGASLQATSDIKTKAMITALIILIFLGYDYCVTCTSARSTNQLPAQTKPETFLSDLSLTRRSNI
jgi:hypothetical protein